MAYTRGNQGSDEEKNEDKDLEKGCGTLRIQEQLLLKKTPARLSQAEYIKGREELADIRNEQATALLKDALELKEIVQDLATIVNDQQDDIDTVEKNIENTAEQVGQAEMYLAHAEQSSTCVIL